MLQSDPILGKAFEPMAAVAQNRAEKRGYFNVYLALVAAAHGSALQLRTRRPSYSRITVAISG